MIRFVSSDWLPFFRVHWNDLLLLRISAADFGKWLEQRLKGPKRDE